MARTHAAQLNIRSSFARTRVQELARLTGVTVTQIVDDALRGYVPPSTPASLNGLVQRGSLLVRPRRDSTVSLEEAIAALDATREHEG